MSNEEPLTKKVDVVQYPFFISTNFSLREYFTVRGAEYVLTYLWILKDLSWMQGYHYPSIVFGILTLSWCGVLAIHAIIDSNVEELYMLVGMTMWLFGGYYLCSISLTKTISANFWWMYGEIANNDDYIHAPESGYMLEVTLQNHVCETNIKLKLECAYLSVPISRVLSTTWAHQAQSWTSEA